MSDSPRFVSVAESAAEAKVPTSSVYRWIKAKAVPSQRSNGLLLVDATAVNRFAAARRPGGFIGIPETSSETSSDNGKVGMEQPTANRPPPPGPSAPAPNRPLDPEMEASILRRYQSGESPPAV